MEEPTFEDYLEIRRLSDCLYDIQETRKRVINRMRKMPYIEIFEDLEPIEDRVTKLIAKKLKHIPIWTEFISKVKGVGPRLGGYVIGKTMVKFIPVSAEELADYSPSQQKLAQKTENGKYMVPTRRGIEAFDNISKYWAYWGLGVEDGHAPRLKKGEKAGYDPVNRAKTWNISNQFVMQGDIYRATYDRYKKRKTAERTPPEKCPKYGINPICKKLIAEGKEPSCTSHIHNMSRRYAVKEFFKDLWLNWRTLEGLPITEPYVIDVLGHEKKDKPPLEDSHSEGETQQQPASQDRDETHQMLASQKLRETHNATASHPLSETHQMPASQKVGEAQ